MKAAILTENNKLELKEVVKPIISKDDVLIKIEACAICGSDIRILNYGNKRIKSPQILGHEIAGKVIEIGENVKGYNIGDHLSLSADIPCGHCDWCKEGLSNNCESVIAFGYEYPGGFSEFLKLDKRILDFGPVVKMDKQIPFDVSCLAEPLACCINGLEIVNMEICKSVIILGAGPIGVMLSKLANIMGASKVFLCDIDQDRLDASKDISKADYVFNLNTNYIKEYVMKRTNNNGIDIVITACPSLEAQKSAFEIVKKRGTINFFGGLPQTAEKLNIDSNLIHYNEITVIGSHGSTPRHHKIACDLISTNKIDLMPLISKKYSLDNINEAFNDAQKNRKLLKIIIKPNYKTFN